MNVRELIERLQQYDGDLMVVTDGYEGGVNEVKELEISRCKLNENNNTAYYGNHKLEEPWDERKDWLEVVYIPSIRDKVGDDGSNSDI